MSETEMIRLLFEGQVRMEQSITEIKESLAEQRGARKAAAWIGGVVGSALTLVVNIGWDALRGL